jgi:plastocyanin
VRLAYSISAICAASAAAALAAACGDARSPTSPEPREILSILVEAHASTSARDVTGHRWRFSWGLRVNVAGTASGTSTGQARILMLPSPVRLIETAAVFRAPDGRVLQENSAPEAAWQQRVGGNEVLPGRDFGVGYTGLFAFAEVPPATARSGVTTRVVLADGAGVMHEVRIETSVAFVTRPPGPCVTGRGMAPPRQIEITAAGFRPSVSQETPGRCVRFVNADTAAHDIRADPHPGHDGCPEFNVGLIIPGQQVLTPAFQTFGACSYHDELRPGAPAFSGRVDIG